MRSLANETPEQRERRLAGYRKKNAASRDRIKLYGPAGDENSPEEQARIKREIEEMRMQKHAMAMAGGA